jgi:predicted esterase
VPASYRATTPAPVALMFHGAGRNATEMLDPIRPIADTLGMVLVA